MSLDTQKSTRLSLDTLENRDMMSVSSVWFSGTNLVVRTDNVSTAVTANAVGSNIVISEVGTNRSWTYAASRVGSLEMQGGAGNDRFINNVSSLRLTAFGNGGNDYLEGYSQADRLVGGDGNDTLVGYGGNDSMWGGAGNDKLMGMTGNDQLVGDDGNDYLNGGAGNDSMWGGNGNDVLIAIDNGTSDYMNGGAGSDAMWGDRNSSWFMTYRDTVADATSADGVQHVASFTNGADRTLDGDSITDPTVKSGASYMRFSNNPLFSASGPRATDIRQGALGDCWVLAGLSGIALDSPNTVRQRVVDFADGTYGVKLGNNFYRVDADLPVYNGTSSLAYAKLGAENSMWVAVVEKAYTHYRTGANSYASIENGWAVDVNVAFGATSTTHKTISSYASATAMANDVYNRWLNYEAVTMGFTSIPAGANLINSHMYTVMSFVRNGAGQITHIVLRNPWGYDGVGNDSNTSDGLLTVSINTLYGCVGRVDAGRVHA